MSELYEAPFRGSHEHVFLGASHDKNERKTWAVIVLCSVMMVAEILGGQLFGSLALIADGLHMSTHAGAMLIAALAYTYARRHANDPRFVFGTGKMGDLAGFTSAIILAMIAALIAYEAIMRMMDPVAIRFSEAIPIAVLGLLVNIGSAWLLSGGEHHGHSHGHAHGHSHSHAHDHDHDDSPAHHHDSDSHTLLTSCGALQLTIFEQGIPPVFRVTSPAGAALPPADSLLIQTSRGAGAGETYHFALRDGYLESTSSIAEPHAFDVQVRIRDQVLQCRFDEHAHPEHVPDSRDHNMRAAYIHVIADAAVSVLAIIGLLLARAFGWLWMDPLAGIVGALVIANWSYGLVRDTGAILLDMNPDRRMANQVRAAVESSGDTLSDLHVWRLGPGHFGVVISVRTQQQDRCPDYYHRLLRQVPGLSHITAEVSSR